MKRDRVLSDKFLALWNIWCNSDERTVQPLTLTKFISMLDCFDRSEEIWLISVSAKIADPGHNPIKEILL
jgi:hypothetical protein